MLVCLILANELRSACHETLRAGMLHLPETYVLRQILGGRTDLRKDRLRDLHKITQKSQMVRKSSHI